MRTLSMIAAAAGLGAKHMETGQGPSDLEKACSMHWVSFLKQTLVRPETKAAEIEQIAGFNHQLMDAVTKTITDGKFPVILGGDHSIAMGTWAGVTKGLSAKGSFGLLWIDAHMDAHTFATTPSQCIHGMPVAVLLGHGDPRFLSMSGAPSIAPEHLVIFGARSYEVGEHALLKKLGVRIFYQEMIDAMGLDTAFKEALAIVQQAPFGFGVSIDLDAFDPKDAPGVGSPEPGGIRTQAFLPLLRRMLHEPLVKALEIVEYNPVLDDQHRTQRLILDILSCFGR